MMGFEQRLDAIEGVIKKENFRQNKGLGNEVGYYVFDYPAAAALGVRDHIDYMKNRNPRGTDAF